MDPTLTSPLLTVRSLTKAFGAETVLNGVSLTLAPGEILGFMGPSGSGKSTLLSCLSGLLLADSGEITLGEQNFSELSESQFADLRRQSISSIFQFFHLLPTLSVYENVELPLILTKQGKKPRRDSVLSMLQEVGMEHRADAFPETLSGGEKQRTAIARALISKPKLLLADEPTGSLDSHTGDTILDLLKSEVKTHNVALVMVTHDQSATRICDRIIHLKDGVISPS